MKNIKSYFKPKLLVFQLTLIGLLIWSHASVAQQGIYQILSQHKPYQEIVADVMTYFNCSNEDSIAANMVHHDNEYIAFKRWQHFAKNHILPTGYLASGMQEWNVYKDIKRTRSATWKSIGQTQLSQTPNGMSRTERIAFDPIDSNKLYLGIWGGGIWKTTNGGNSWIPIGDMLPSCNVGDICIDKRIHRSYISFVEAP
ncbi:MAG: hypothetical protein JNM44_03660 [Chitinophagaceae bacterium]|nr:hypothetical protein [Chitinophagaceae bacterium]